MANWKGRERVHHRVLELRNINESTYVLRFERRGLQFEPGQYISVGRRGDIDMREYSIYSPVQADYLEILIKEVEGGLVSRRLRALEPQDEVYVEGPFGFFLMSEELRQQRVYFVGTGTGISPFHCFVGSIRGLNYTLIHGVRYAQDNFDLDFYQADRLVRCISREGEHSERVSDYLRRTEVDTSASVYLCGNCDMIYEVYDILSDRGIARERMFAEVYF